jgi:peptide/nickel transport system ATP-binding protein
VQELLDQIEMGKGFADRYPAELSGGQKQRVCIARALAAKAEADHLRRGDIGARPAVAEGILKLLLDLQKQENVAYLFITHDLATVKSIADSIAVMYKGQVVRYGPESPTCWRRRLTTIPTCCCHQCRRCGWAGWKR